MVSKKNPGQVSGYLDDNIFRLLKEMAVAEDRSISYLVERAVRRMVIGPVQTLSNNTTAQTEGDLKRARQVDLEEAIAETRSKPKTVTKAAARKK